MTSDLQAQLSAIHRSHARLQQITASLGVTLALIAFVAAAPLLPETVFNGDVSVAGELKVSGNTAATFPGEIRMWWGNKADIPEGWEFCDGKEVTTPGATLIGNKPNLVDRFPKGALASRETFAQLSKNGLGGHNDMPALKISVFDSLNVGGGSHDHALRVRTSHEAGPNSSDDIVARGKDNRKHIHQSADTGDTVPGGGGHSHSLSGCLGTEKGVNADGGDRTGANQPAYQEVFFIIRVK